jgi:diacylglycerol kinase family enzyme
VEASLRVLLVHNPSAGDQDHSAETIGCLVREAGHELEHHSTDEEWERALDGPVELVAIAGGDGTIGTVMRELARRPRLVTLLPVGSANNIAEALGFGEREPEELVAGWPRGATRRFCLGELSAGGHVETVIETVGGGLFAESIARAERVETEGVDKVELGLRLLRRLVDELPARPWRIELDGADHAGDFLAVEAMVIGETGPKIPLAPDADPASPLLDVVLIADGDRARLASYLDDRVAGRAEPALGLTVLGCREAVLTPLHDGPLRIDDELWQPEERGGELRVRTGAALDVLTPA